MGGEVWETSRGLLTEKDYGWDKEEWTDSLRQLLCLLPALLKGSTLTTAHWTRRGKVNQSDMFPMESDPQVLALSPP